MKKQFLIILILVSSLRLSAQIQDIKNSHIQSSGTHFTKPVTDKKWSNSNGKSYTKAKYAAYEGESFCQLKASKDVAVSLHYEIKVDKGELQLQVVDTENKVLFQKLFKADEKNTTEISLKENQEYQIKFIGRQTKGSYFCQWIEK